MLVLLGECVCTGRVKQRVTLGVRILGNPLFACAAVSGHGVAGKGMIGGNEPCVHQGFYKGDKAACVAPGHGNAVGIFEFFRKCFG